VLFVSDTHLTPAAPEGIDRFLRFLRGPCVAAQRVILIGDVFDFWVSPSQARDPALATVLSSLARLTATGVEVGFVEGNRDFAATPELALAGVRRLADVGVVTSGGRRIAFTHGDLLCTRDVRYQALRRIVRTRLVRHVLRSLPEQVAMGLGQGARQGSQLETMRKAHGDMGLVPGAIAGLLRDRDADGLVCGHVHWGRRYSLDVEGTPRDVVVLSAWEDVGTYARLEAGRLDFVRFE
jgi:UDP-2,3-diacylglucosamine hydrolase